MSERFNLGERVVCDGCLKKTGYFIWFQKIGENEKAALTNDPKYKNEFDEGDTIETKKYVPKKFHGFVCGKKNVATHISYLEDDGYNPPWYSINKDKIVPCYEVCVENKNKSWGKRLVPMEYVHKENEKQ